MEIGKLECSAAIESPDERKQIMAWVRSFGFYAYSELGDTISIIYLTEPDDLDREVKCWEIIHLFEGYGTHFIHAVCN